jgi:hypothetical protein
MSSGEFKGEKWVAFPRGTPLGHVDRMRRYVLIQFERHFRESPKTGIGWLSTNPVRQFDRRKLRKQRRPKTVCSALLALGCFDGAVPVEESPRSSAGRKLVGRWP